MSLDSLCAAEPPRALANLRDAGAAAALRPGVLYRSDAPLSTDADPHLQPWPPATVLDLRDPDEKAEPHPYLGMSRVVDLPILEGSRGQRHGPLPAGLEGGLGALYGRMLVGRPAERLVMAIHEVATAPGSVLVHCTAGKDRTGVTVALVLRLAGASADRVVADYARTEQAMPGVFARMARTVQPRIAGIAAAELPEEIVGAPASALRSLLVELGRAGGAEGWYFANGGDAALLAALRARLRTEPRSAA